MRKHLFIAGLAIGLLLPIRLARSADGAPAIRANHACADGRCIFAANQICGGGTHRRAFQ